MTNIFTILITALTLLYGQSPDMTFDQDMATVFDADDGLPAQKIIDIVLDEDMPVAFVEDGSFQWQENQWQPGNRIPEQPDVPTLSLPDGTGDILSRTMNDEVYVIGCENGLYIHDIRAQTWQQVLPRDDRYSWAPVQVGAVTLDSRGRLWFGAQQGVGYKDKDGWHLFTGKDGLPYNHFTCAAAGPDGIVWFGTERGAILVNDGSFVYRHSRRWLPHDRVNAIAVQNDGTAWFATDAGVGRIASVPMTFEQKAGHFQEQVEARHNRMGFVVHCRLKEPHDIETWEPDITDNDGAHTARYGAAQAFRYAVTGDPKAKQLAKRTFKTLKWLSDITHEKGFPARTIVPVDWHQPVNEIFDAGWNERRRRNDPLWKMILPRFVLSEDGKYLWKCDTSSDELAGHYFFYGIYYDLAAETDQEKQAVRQVVGDITDHLIRHDFKLVDHDGKPTRWAKFSTDYFHTPWGWEQRGLNSMMILSFLKVAAHVTENPKYQAVADSLIEHEAYHINAMNSKIFFPPSSVVPWDNNLSLMSWYGLMNYETDPELMLMYRISIEKAWLHISQKKHAFWNMLYKACTDRFTELVDSGVYNSAAVYPEGGSYAELKVKELYHADAHTHHTLETLRRIPLDLIDYRIDNTHRLDVVFDQAPRQRPNVGWHVDGTALPIDERDDVRFNQDAFRLDAGSSGTREFEGTFYLLPYYMARYHGVIN
ncbi:hypothetical protein GF406_00550 [candidate division KSB1 bacterium]|nr:hypothetical protein [candidate division KSB1 bacterium]